MSSIATPAPAAPAAPPSLGDLVAQRLSGPATAEGGQLQTTAQPETAPTPEAPAVAGEQPQTSTPEVETAPASVETEAPTEEAIEPFSLGLDDDLGTLPAAAEGEQSEEPKPAETPKPPSMTEEMLQDLASAMPRAEAEKMMGALLRLPKGREMLAGLKERRAVAEKIGYAPTPDEIVTFQQSHVQHSRFWDDFSNPQNHTQVFQGLFGVTPEGGITAGAEEFVSALPDALKVVNPRMYEKVAVPVARDMSASFRQIAAEAASPEDKARWEDAAQLIEYATGLSNGTAQQDSPEVAQLREQLNRVNAQQAQGAQAAFQQAHKAATGAYFAEVQKALASDVTKALEPIKGKVDDVTFRAYHRDLHGEILKVYQQYRTNEAVAKRINDNISAAVSRRDRSLIQQEVNRARKVYEVKLGELRTPYLKAGSRAAVEAAKATADKLQLSQNKTEPTQSASSSSSGPSVGLPSRKEGESAQDYLNRSMDAMFNRG